MKIGEKLKGLFRGRPLTEEEYAARAEAEAAEEERLNARAEHGAAEQNLPPLLP